MNHSVLLVASFVVFALACNHDATRPPRTTTLTSAALDARSTLARGGEYRFVLDASPGVLANVKGQCASDASPDACVDRIRQAGSREGWRFAPIDADHATLQSFGVENGHDEIYLEARVVFEQASGASLVLRADGAVKGTRVPPGAATRSFRVEMLDADSFAVDDPKGRMVFRRGAP